MVPAPCGHQKRRRRPVGFGEHDIEPDRRSPGILKISNTVLWSVMKVIDVDMNIRAAVDAPRLHQPWFPDTAYFEGAGEHAEAVQQLEAMGHTVSGTRQGDAHSIWLDPKTGQYVGAEDRRINGKVSGF